MLLINCEIDLILTCWANCVITNITGAATIPITDKKLYIPEITLSTQDRFNKTLLLKLVNIILHRDNYKVGCLLDYPCFNKTIN